MVNHCIRIAKENDNCSSLKRLSILSYHELEQYDTPSYYKLCAISKASGIISSMKKSIKRGRRTKSPYMQKDMVLSCYGFKIDLENKILRIPVGNRDFLNIPLNNHTISVIKSNPKIKAKSFLITHDLLSLSLAKQIDIPENIQSIYGIDNNLENLSVGNEKQVKMYDTSKILKIKEITRDVCSSFKRNDHRIRQKIYSKYGRRRTERVKNMLHKISKDVINNTKNTNGAIVFEDIEGIRKLYKKGNWQGKNHRSIMNSWSYGEIKYQIEYKAKWEGVPVIHLSKQETRGTSSLCYICGERLQSSKDHKRELWCDKCERWQNRDTNAVMNISYRGLSRFDSSEGLAVEVMKRNLENVQPVILGVDASKLFCKVVV